MESHPSVRRVQVQRVPPSRLDIKIEERHALAYALNPEDGNLYGIDREGVVLPPYLVSEFSWMDRSDLEPEIQQILSCPVINGEISIPFIPGQAVEDSRVLEGLKFFETLVNHDANHPSLPPVFPEIVEAEFMTNGNLHLHFRRRIGALVLRDLNSQDLDKKIGALWNVMEKENLRAIYVDARFPKKSFAVRWDESDGARWKRLYASPSTSLSQASSPLPAESTVERNESM